MKILFYAHSGSINHGCEAIARTSASIIGKYFDGEIELMSANPDTDKKYINSQNLKIEKTDNGMKKYSMLHFIIKANSILIKSKNIYLKLTNRNLLKFKNGIAISIGGDNYCYDGVEKTLAYFNKRLNRNKCKTVLWGCSIEPDLLLQPEIVEDLKLYSLITPRESITYKALLKAGITKNTHLYPDPAFTLDTVMLDLPIEFIKGNTIGINISPHTISCEEKAGTTMENFITLIEHILISTDMHIAFIPHVGGENNDEKPHRELWNRFKDTGRIIVIEDHNCMALKGFIARCRMFIGTRTHATIAAYSSCVPTLVVGYSIKSIGIAKDIFGKHENYVIPVKTLENSDDLINAFEWMKEYETAIRTHLSGFMPGYIARARDAGEEVRKLMVNDSIV